MRRNFRYRKNINFFFNKSIALTCRDDNKIFVIININFFFNYIDNNFFEIDNVIFNQHFDS